MRRAILIYRRRCRKCRVLSLVAVGVALGTLRRVADDSIEAARLDVPRGESGRLKLTLLAAGLTLTGGRALVGIPLCPLLALTGRTRSYGRRPPYWPRLRKRGHRRKLLSGLRLVRVQRKTDTCSNITT